MVEVSVSLANVRVLEATKASFVKKSIVLIPLALVMAFVQRMEFVFARKAGQVKSLFQINIIQIFKGNLSIRFRL